MVGRCENSLSLSFKLGVSGMTVGLTMEGGCFGQLCQRNRAEQQQQRVMGGCGSGGVERLTGSVVANILEVPYTIFLFIYLTQYIYFFYNAFSLQNR